MPLMQQLDDDPDLDVELPLVVSWTRSTPLEHTLGDLQLRRGLFLQPVSRFTPRAAC